MAREQLPLVAPLPPEQTSLPPHTLDFLGLDGPSLDGTQQQTEVVHLWLQIQVLRCLAQIPRSFFMRSGAQTHSTLPMTQMVEQPLPVDLQPRLQVELFLLLLPLHARVLHLMVGLLPKVVEHK